MKNVAFFVCLLFLSNVSFADKPTTGYSTWAVPTTVELVGEGVLVHGDFGDPSSCGVPNYIFVSQSDESYESVLSIALAALMGKRELRFFTGRCVEIGLHWSGDVISQNLNGGSVYIR